MKKTDPRITIRLTPKLMSAIRRYMRKQKLTSIGFVARKALAKEVGA